MQGHVSVSVLAQPLDGWRLCHALLLLHLGRSLLLLLSMGRIQLLLLLLLLLQQRR